MATQAVTPQEEPKTFRREIDLKDGSGVQVFEAPTQDELIDKLAQAQEHATRKIREQNKALKLRAPNADPLNKPQTATAKAMTADEQFLMAQELQDPSKAPAAIRKAIEAELGAPIDELRESINARREEKLRQEAMREASAFVGEHPEYYNCPENNQLMEQWLAERNYACTKKNFELAFEDLSGLLKQPEAPKEVAEEPRIEVPKPRKLVSTGIRPSQGTATPVHSQPKWTQQQIDAMSARQYRELLETNPEFKRFMDGK